MKKIGIYFLLLLLFFLFLLTILLALRILYSLFNRNKHAPSISSFDKDLRLIKDFLFLGKGKKIVDLGCGDGKMLRFFVKNFSLEASGYDLNPFAVYLARLLNKIQGYKQIKIIKSDFLLANLSDFDYIYIYLLPKQLAMIEDWLWENKKKDALIISNSFQFQKHKPHKILKDRRKGAIFLYK